VIDWHSHILPGIDDGPAEMEQSVAMASALSAAGFTTVYCTPHLMRGCYEAGNNEIRRSIARLQERLDSKNIPLTLLPGREYCLDEYLLDALADPLTLGNSRLVLVEIPAHLTAVMVRQLLYEVVRFGFTPVIAHPERCQLLEPVVRRTGNGSVLDAFKSLLTGGRNGGMEIDPPNTTGNSLLDYLRDLGCGFQGNLGSFSGFYGRRVKVAAETLRSMGIYDRYGSDLHAPEQAEVILKNGRCP
jgi:protein-tyrosine phosphatase